MRNQGEKKDYDNHPIAVISSVGSTQITFLCKNKRNALVM